MNKQRIALYIEYEKELEAIIDDDDGEQETSEQFIRRMQDLHDTNKYTWIDISKNREIIGFLIIGYGEVCHPLCDYFLAQAYIAPEYRETGYMTKAINSWLETHQGKYCMYIINNNKYAKNFWDNRFREYGYSENRMITTPEAWYNKNICYPVIYSKNLGVK